MPKRGQRPGDWQSAGSTSTVRKKNKRTNEGLSKQIKTLIGVVIVLVLLLCVLLLAERVLKQRLSDRSRTGETTLSEPLPAQSSPREASPLLEATAPATVTAAPLPPEEPEETLPIIMTNTPTPTPSPTPTPTPEPTPTPSPSPVPDLAHGITQKTANLRSSASGSAKIKKKVKKGEALTIHDVTLDAQKNKWYSVTLDDTGTAGWMRDYLIEVTDGEAALGSFTEAAPDETSAAGQTSAVTASGATPIGRATANRAANIRQRPVANAAIVRQVSEGTQLYILRRVAYQDIEWFEVETTSGKTRGYVRRYTVKVQTIDENAEVEAYAE
ncbi:MAG: SH3 domain-containing protein [Clostridia bacterium]|nr:SH3 domain-containing protein [Clostridia bacterium]